MKTLKHIASVVTACALVACGTQQETSQPEKVVPDFWPALDIEVKQDSKIEAKVDALLATMTTEQKVAQMIQPEIRDITPEDMRKYGFGSYLNGGGSFPHGKKHSTPGDWIDLAEAMYQASVDSSLDGSSIPTMWGTDAVHGHNNVIGATIFPHNIGLGAANNPDLIEKIAHITAVEVMATGIDWIFAPTVATVRDDRWGRTYESYSEDPAIVKAYAASIVKGLQGEAGADFLGDDRVISTVKHFLGDGGTEKGDDQGNNVASEKELFDIHAQGYVSGLTVGAQSVMASFNSWHGDKIHGSKYLLTDVLKDRMGFDGFVVGDWNGHGQVAGCSNDNCAQAANAGLDIYMVPTMAWKGLYDNVLAQVNSGVIPISRIDDAVRRILRVKFRAGLFDKPSPAKRKLSGKVELIGAKAHRDIAKQAVRESLVLLKNKGKLLPLTPQQSVLVAGDGADNIGKQSGGWTISWQGTGNTNADFPGGTSIWDGINQQVTQAGGNAVLSLDGSYTEKPDVAIVVFGEEPYAEGNGDLENLEYQRGNKKDLALLKRLKSQGIPVVSVFITGRPMWVNAELNQSDAFVVAWLPGSEGSAVADVLLKDQSGNTQQDFKGKLSFSWPNAAMQTTTNKGDAQYNPLLPYGFGLTYADANTLGDDLETQSDSGTSQLEELVIFEKALKYPWRTALSEGEKHGLVDSGAASNAAVSFHSIDKEVQEDGRKISFVGGIEGRYEINDNFPTDLRGYFEAGGVLTWIYKVEAKPSKAVSLSMLCEQQCDADLDITEQLTRTADGNWHQVNIALECFAKQGATPDKIVAPFALTTDGAFGVSYSYLALKLEQQASADFVCQ